MQLFLHFVQLVVKMPFELEHIGPLARFVDLYDYIWPLCFRIKLSQSSAKAFKCRSRKGFVERGLKRTWLDNWYILNLSLFLISQTRRNKVVSYNLYVKGRPCVWMLASIQFLDNVNIIAIYKQFGKSWYMGPLCIWSLFCSKLGPLFKNLWSPF